MTVEERQVFNILLHKKNKENKACVSVPAIADLLNLNVYEVGIALLTLRLRKMIRISGKINLQSGLDTEVIILHIDKINQNMVLQVSENQKNMGQETAKSGEIEVANYNNKIINNKISADNIINNNYKSSRSDSDRNDSDNKNIKSESDNDSDRSDKGYNNERSYNKEQKDLKILAEQISKIFGEKEKLELYYSVIKFYSPELVKAVFDQVESRHKQGKVKNRAALFFWKLRKIRR